MKLLLLSFLLVLSKSTFSISFNDTVYTTSETDYVNIFIENTDSTQHILLISSVKEASFKKQLLHKTWKISYYHNRIKGEHQIYIIVDNTKPTIQTVTVIVRNKTWWLWMVFSILGGLGLFLFGIHYMSDGFINLFGHKLSNIAQQFSRTSGESILTGAMLTTFLQSSSASSIFLMKLVHNRLMTFRQTVGIIIGGALGTTITLQIIALKLNNYALFLIAIGFILTFLFKYTYLKRIGQIFTGLGFLYLGLLIMTDGAIQIKTVPSIMEFLINLSNPIACILTGIVFTALTQSASAFIGILMMFSSIGALSLQSSILLLIGSNIGTSVPVLLDSIQRIGESKKIAWFHLFYRFLVAVLFVFWIREFSNLVESLSVFLNNGKPVSMPHLIANSHTFMYLSVTIVCMPLIPFLYKYFSKFISVTETQDPFKPKYINDESLDTPSIAIILAKKETMHIANIVVKMVEELLPAFIQKDKKRIETIEYSEKIVNTLRDGIISFLIQLNKKNQNIEIAKEIYKLLSIVKELEEIADIVDTNLIPKAKFWSNTTINFSEEGKKELEHFHQHCLLHLHSVIKTMASYDLKSAKKLKKKEKQTIQLAYELEKSHYSRLMSEIEASIQSSKTHIELIGLLQAITRHATQIIRILYEFD